MLTYHLRISYCLTCSVPLMVRPTKSRVSVTANLAYRKCINFAKYIFSKRKHTFGEPPDAPRCPESCRRSLPRFLKSNLVETFSVSFSGVFANVSLRLTQKGLAKSVNYTSNFLSGIILFFPVFVQTIKYPNPLFKNKIWKKK